MDTRRPGGQAFASPAPTALAELAQSGGGAGLLCVKPPWWIPREPPMTLAPELPHDEPVNAHGDERKAIDREAEPPGA